MRHNSGLGCDKTGGGMLGVPDNSNNFSEKCLARIRSLSPSKGCRPSEPRSSPNEILTSLHVARHPLTIQAALMARVEPRPQGAPSYETV